MLFHTPRYSQFVQNGVTHFFLRASTELLKAKSKDNVAAESFLTKAIGASIKPASKEASKAFSSDVETTTVSADAPLVGAVAPVVGAAVAVTVGGVAVAPVVGAAVAVTGHILKFVVGAKNKTDQHNNAKKIEKFFAGYDPEDAKWIKLLVSVFHEIFKAYNVQVCL